MSDGQKILVSIDISKSDYVLDEAVEVAKRYNLELIVMHVVSTSAQDYNSLSFIEQKMHQDAKLKLSEIKNSMASKNINIETEILVGQPATVISNFANDEKNNIKLIVIGSRDIHGIKKLILGSVCQGVIQKSKVNTLVVVKKQ